MKYKLIIFDFDGTLADSFPWFMSVFNDVAAKYKLKNISESDRETLRGYSAKQLLKHMQVPAWKTPSIARHIRSLMTKDIHTVPLFDGITPLLQNLAQQGAQLAVVSSNSYENVHYVLGPDNANLISYYECGVALHGKTKKLRKVLEKSGVSPAHTIYIGDEIRDIEAAKELQIVAGSVAWGYTHAAALQAHAPNLMFANIEEIIKKVAL